MKTTIIKWYYCTATLPAEHSHNTRHPHVLRFPLTVRNVSSPTDSPYVIQHFQLGWKYCCHRYPQCNSLTLDNWKLSSPTRMRIDAEIYPLPLDKVLGHFTPGTIHILLSVGGNSSVCRWFETDLCLQRSWVKQTTGVCGSCTFSKTVNTVISTCTT